jgi:cysteine desulfurase
LYVRRLPPVRLTPQIHGGGHERGMRSGTLATHQIVGIGEAARILKDCMESENARVAALRNRLWSHLKQLDGVQVNGDLERRLPGNLNVSFAGVDGETLMTALDDVAVSSGSACTSATVEPSYVLRAIGVPDELAHASVRFTVGRFTTEDDIDKAARRVIEVVERLRERSAA